MRTRMPPDPDAYTMSFGDHLEELRKRLVLGLVAPLPLFIVIFIFSDPLIEWLLQPVFAVLAAHDLPTELQTLSPPEILVTKVKLSVIAALVVTAPWLLWQLWLFVAPGLLARERRFVHLLLPGSALLTVAGVLLLYYVMLPLMLHVLVMVGADIDVSPPREPDARADALLAQPGEVPVVTVAPAEPKLGERWLDITDGKLYGAAATESGGVERLELRRPSAGSIEQSFRVSHVVNFTLVLMLGTVIAFQMPLVILLLGWLDVVRAETLRQSRRYALLVCAVVAAVITPADAVSMIVMLVPLYALYELGILLLGIAPASAVAEGKLVWRFGQRR